MKKLFLLAALLALYPPRRLVFAGCKQEKVLEIYAAGRSRFVRPYPILRLSGELGPKLREGDRQVPEGIYAAIKSRLSDLKK